MMSNDGLNLLRDAMLNAVDHAEFVVDGKPKTAEISQKEKLPQGTMVFTFTIRTGESGKSATAERLIGGDGKTIAENKETVAIPNDGMLYRFRIAINEAEA